MTKEIRPYQDSRSHLIRLHEWGLYMDGARNMLRLLRENCLCKEPHPPGTKIKDEDIYNKATLDLIMDSKDNVDRFLSQDYDLIQFTDHERDKKGKLIKCRAYFARKVARIEEI